MTAPATPADGPAPSLEGATLDARYRITSTLGAGGMATVYLAHDERLERSVVVKLPHTALAVQPDFVARFQREIKSLTKIEHPHVLKVLDTGSHAGLPYAVLQHLSGGSLRDRLDRAGGKLPAVEVLAWLLQVASALDHIHERGLVHRDVKPGNVLYDDTGNVVLADFGIAKSLASTDTGITATGMTPGSPGYMAPEVMKGGALGPKYDQFSLAVMVFEALAGRLPFAGSTPIEQIGSLLNEPPADLASLVSELPPVAAEVVMRALSKDPAARFASCTEFAKTFQAALGVPTVQVFPKQFAAAMRRRRWLRAGIAAAALAAAVGVGVWLAPRSPMLGVEKSAAVDAPKTDAKPDGIRPPPGDNPWNLVAPPEGPAWAKVSQRQIDEAKRLGVRVAFENEFGMRFVLIPAGKFEMGSPAEEPGRAEDELQHEVRIDRPLYVQTTEVTNAQYRRLVPNITRRPGTA